METYIGAAFLILLGASAFYFALVSAVRKVRDEAEEERKREQCNNEQ